MTVKDRSTLLADLPVVYPDNESELITPGVHRGQQADVIDSFFNILDEGRGFITITSEQDWIDSTIDLTGDIRQMTANATYFIDGLVNHGFTLRANGVNRISSQGVLNRSNDYTGPNTEAYECTSASNGISFDNITINCPGKTWMASTAAQFIAADRCSIQCDIIGNCDASIVFFAFTRFGNVGNEFTGGMAYAGVANLNIDVTNCAFFPDSATADLSCIDFKASTWGDVRIESSKFNLGGTNLAINGLASAGNLINAGFVNHCDMTGSTDALLGVSEHDDPWIFTGNLGTSDSGASIGGFVENNASVTVIGVGAGDDGNPIQVNVGLLATGYIDERFSISTAGVLTYNGTNPILKGVSFIGQADTAAGNNVPYTFYIAVDGVVIPGSRGPISLDSADPGVFATQALVGLANGSEISLFVEENSGTTNITITDFSVVVN